MAICLIGAGTNLPEPRQPQDPIAQQGCLADPRPFQADHQMMADTAQKAVQDALEQAGTRADEIDLIVTMGISPSHVADDPEILGPRVGHPIQRDMDISKAFVFDTLDGDLNFAMDLAESFFNLYPFKRALLIHAECGAPSVKPCPETGMALSDGVSALVVSPDFSRTEMGASYADISDRLDPLSMYPLPRDKETATTELVRLDFKAPPTLFSSIREAASQVINQEATRFTNPSAEFVMENWFADSTPEQDELAEDIRAYPTPEGFGRTGPHTIALAAREKIEAFDPQENDEGQFLLTTFNPYKMRLGCRSVRIRRAS